MATNLELKLGYLYDLSFDIDKLDLFKANYEYVQNHFNLNDREMKKNWINYQALRCRDEKNVNKQISY